MPEPIVYRFVAMGEREVSEAFRSIEASAKAARIAVDDLGRASSRVRAPREVGGLGPGAGRGGPYRSSGGGSSPEVAAVRATAERIISIEQKMAERRAIIFRKFEEQRLGIVRTSTRQIEREIAKEERAHQRSRSQFLRNPMSMVPGLVSSVGGSIIGGAGAIIGEAVEQVSAMYREVQATQALANRVSVNARMAGKGYIDPTELRKEWQTAAIANPGITATDVGKGVKGYIAKTGDINAAREFAGTFATFASATESSVEDVASVSAHLAKKFDIKSVEQLRAALAALAYQGKEGEFEIHDAAARFGKMASAAQRFGMMKGPEGVRVLGGLAQLSKGSNDSPAEAATAVERMFGSLIKHSRKLEAAGIHVFKKGSRSETNDIREILPELIAKRGGGLAALGKDLDDRGIRAVSGLISKYNETKGTAGEKKDAVKRAFEEAINAAGEWKDITRDAAQIQSGASEQLTAAWEQLKAAAGDRLIPVLSNLITKIATNQKVLDLFAAAIDVAGVSLEALADFLQKKGLISGGSPEEQRATAVKKVARYEAELQGMGGEKGYDKLSKADQRRYDILYTKRNKAAQEVSDFDRAAAIDRGKAGRVAEFEWRYANLASPGEHKAEAPKLARVLGQAIEAGEKYASPEGENKAQREERRRFESGEGAYAREGGGELSLKAIIAEAMADQKAAAAEQKQAAVETKDAARKLGAVNRPTVAGGTK